MTVVHNQQSRESEKHSTDKKSVVFDLDNTYNQGDQVKIIITGEVSGQCCVVLTYSANPNEAGSALPFHECNQTPPPQVTFPPGTVIAYAGPIINDTDVPTGWLICDGRSVDRTKYPALFNAIGWTAGTEDHRNMFNLPDYSGRFLRGQDHRNGRDPGPRKALSEGGNSKNNEVSTLEDGEIKSHTHTIVDPGHSHSTWDSYPGVHLAGTPDPFPYAGGSMRGGTQGGTSHSNISVEPTGGAETRPVNVSVNYLIKY